MERDIRQELLDAIATWTPTPAQLAVLDARDHSLYVARCSKWFMKLFDAVSTVNRCANIGSKHYEQETLGYIVWLLHKRPMKGKADDIFRPEGEL